MRESKQKAGNEGRKGGERGREVRLIMEVEGKMEGVGSNDGSDEGIIIWGRREGEKNERTRRRDVMSEEGRGRRNGTVQRN